MYPTDLTDSGCGFPPEQVIAEILADKRKRKYSLRAIFNALLYVTNRDANGDFYPTIYHPGLCAITIFGNGAMMVTGTHRHMGNHFEKFLAATQLTDHKPISRAQLPLLLAKVNGSYFTQLLFEGFGLVLGEEQKQCGAAL